ncbi:hypothetical protein G6M89_10265 [Natronolimnobius sp. AArcel1]|uniref:hypothetical protein n=1 Tax=Natronolimnobius sp. AArcel1 TaxID=1679093 RepID=UPI0013ED6AF1|nr:hypothetical protein [Natronolimnobius sp. AArcel1]NGM69387.1 hypothetical protein [Natronolimnobius sp. AArcel1]
MVPTPPSPTRRQLLGGVAGAGILGSGGTVAVGLLRPTALPNVVADWATNAYPTPPPANSHWHPPVTDDHARDAISLLEETVEETTTLREGIDSDEYHLRGIGAGVERATESLEDGNAHDALSEVTYSMQFAAEELGKARAIRDEADLEALAERSFAVYDRIDAVFEALEPYPVVDPERDLAWYAEIEAELQLSEHHVSWADLEAFRDDEDADPPDSTAYEPREIGDITAGVRQAELAIETAERYHDLLADEIGDAGSEYGDHLRTLAADLEADVESRYVDDDIETYGPYEYAHSELAHWSFPSVSPPWERLRSESRTLITLELAQALVNWRAHEFAADDLVIEPGQSSFDPGHVFDGKRRARSTYQSEIGSDPSPLLAELAERGIMDLRVATIRRDSWDSDNWSAWRERVQAYCYVLISHARLREYPAVYDRILEPM